MLRIIFIGREVDLLRELQAHCKIEAVYFEQPTLPAWKPRNLILRTYWMRKKLLPLLSSKKHRYRKWLRTASLYDVHDVAKSNGLKIISGKQFDTATILAAIKPMKLDLGVVANFSHIIHKELFESARYGFINFHPSLLPQYRGPNPFDWVLLNEDAETGVTFHRIVEKLDAGNILAQQKIAVSDTDTIGDLMCKSVQTAREMLGGLLESIEQETQEEWVQNESKASYFGEMTEQQREKLNRILSQRQRAKVKSRGLR